ncbi:MAG: LamG domain-containing protein [Planctomycetota bacterium]|jgi:hypothetical protein
MTRWAFLLIVFVLLLGPAGMVSADTNVGQGQTLTIDSNYTDEHLNVVGTLIIEPGADITFSGRGIVNADRDFENEVGAEIIMNGGSFHLLGDSFGDRLTLGQTKDAYLIINNGYFRVGTMFSSDDAGDTKLADDPGGVHRLIINGGTFRTHRMEVDGGGDGLGERNSHIIIGGGVLIVEDPNEGKPSDWTEVINQDTGLPILMPAEGYDSLIIEDYNDGEKVTAVAGAAAVEPYPEDSTEEACPDVVLHWTPGPKTQPVNGHDVYFGTDLTDVTDANTLTPVIYLGRQSPNNLDPAGLQLGETYYWRIDEVNDANASSPWKGYIWSFTTNDGNAYDPEPENEAIKVELDQVLAWKAGCGALNHDVYFSTDFDEVDSLSTVAFQINQTETTWNPGGLDYLVDYYWRIVEHGGLGTFVGPVWHFTARSMIVDPNLLLWYKLDPNVGDLVPDSSGRQFHGTGEGFNENTWDPDDSHDGGGSIDMDGGQGIEVPLEVVSMLDDHEVSVSLWFKGARKVDQPNWIFAAGGQIASWPVEWTLGAAIPARDGSTVLFIAGEEPTPDDDDDPGEPAEADSNDVLEWTEGEGASPTGWEPDWHHIVLIKNENANTMSMYFDGLLADQRVDANDDTLSTLKVRASDFRIGSHWKSDDDFNGKIDDFRLYDYALSETDVISLFRGGDVGTAWAPSPGNGQGKVPYNATLSWRPGDFAATHEVYFGTDWDDVNDATTSSSTHKATRTLGNEDYDPGLLDLKTTYYWRIDEVNGPNTWKGYIWRFTVADFLIVDDMESYDAIPSSGNEIFDTWDDGFSNWSGAQVALEYTGGATIHAGKQSMKMQYDNAIGYYKYSEIDANTTGPVPGNLEIGTDWTAFGVKALTLFFYGQPGNDTSEQMYAAIDDGSSNIGIALYGDLGESMNDVAAPEWHQWDIPLSAFSDDGVTLTDVTKVRIGFGDRDNPVVGGTGIVYFDDIRLYLPKCVPWLAKPVYDFSNDCIVNFTDLRMMAQDWLLSDIDVAPVTAPSAPVLHYAFEDTSGSSVTDSAGGYTGTFFTDMTTAPADISARVDADGKSGNSFHFSSPLGYAGIKVPSTVFTDNGISQEITISVWIKNAHPDEEPDGDSFMWEFREWNGISEDANDRVLAVEMQDDADTYVFHDQNESVSYEMDWERHTGWKHYAFVRNDSNLAIYVNGVLEAISDSNGTALATPQLLYLGIAADRSPTSTEDMHDGFTGNVDEWKIFDYALSAAEVGHIASDGTGVVLMDSAYNIYDTESAGSRAINFRDYAELMDSWLEVILWPQ